MPQFGQRLDGLCYVAWNIITNVGQTGDAANHRLRLVRDGLEIIPQLVPAEVDSTGAPGLYKLSLTADEMFGNIITLAGTSLTPQVILVPVQITTFAAQSAFGVSTIVRSSQIWTDQQLNQWSEDAIRQIGIDVKCIFARECLAVQKGQSVYRLPSYLRTLARVVWRGRSVVPTSWEEFQRLSLATSVVSIGSPANHEGSFSRPQFYVQHPTNPYEIRFYPTPNESFTVSGEFDPYAPTPNSPACVISFWREPDVTNSNPVISLPSYITRRTQKALVLWRAFSAEGKGQSLKAAQFYQNKYNFLINQFRLINEGCFVAKKYSLDDGTFEGGWRPPRPSLPPQFESVRF